MCENDDKQSWREQRQGQQGSSTETQASNWWWAQDGRALRMLNHPLIISQICKAVSIDTGIAFTRCVRKQIDIPPLSKHPQPFLLLSRAIERHPIPITTHSPSCYPPLAPNHSKQCCVPKATAWANPSQSQAPAALAQPRFSQSWSPPKPSHLGQARPEHH